ncbi:hypothetical protein CRENBAI_006737 [Crenichthys baileyi]|uniref:Uncharacterized protein n=1 Tax=Crenichthys baileyi TaxID=28760 RepID=A0AAV9RMY4_9TELE
MYIVNILLMKSKVYYLTAIHNGSFQFLRLCRQHPITALDWKNGPFVSVLQKAKFIRSEHLGEGRCLRRLHSGTFRTVALQQEGPGFKSWPVVFLYGVQVLPICVFGVSLSTAASSYSLKHDC